MVEVINRVFDMQLTQYTDTNHFPIPEDWVAGSYDVILISYIEGIGMTEVSTVSVTVPALPEAEPPKPELQSSGLEATVLTAPGTSTPGCEETNSCFIPSRVKIDLGGTITWENVDNAAHTVTSCIFSDDVCKVRGLQWDSGFMTKGSTFSHTFEKEGIYLIC